MAGKAHNISKRESPDPRFQNFTQNAYGVSYQNTIPTTNIKEPKNRYLKLRGGIMESMSGAIWGTAILSSGNLDLTKDSSGNDVIPRAHIFVSSESGSVDTLDLIEMEGTQLQGARLTLISIVGTEIIITHNGTPSGTKKGIYCPGGIDYILDSFASVDLIFDASADYWRIIGNAIMGELEINVKESDEADIRLYRDDGTPNDNNVLGNLIWSGNDDAGDKTDYAEISGVSEDVTNGTESGTLRLRVLQNGTMKSVFDIDGENQIIDIADTYNFKFSTTTGTKIGTASTQKIGFFGVTPVVQRSAYTVTNGITDRTYNADSTSVAELADVLATLLVDLKSLGLIA